ncbi:MAG: DedA family protein [Buchnera aphidicola (Eriosoma harunire)]
MKHLLECITTLPSMYLLIVITIISFLESLAIVGLFLPGIILMASLGTLIGNGKLLFYPAWIAGTIGCIFGDWLSYYFGCKFKQFISKLSFIKNNASLLQKTQTALFKHSFITILVGRFIGPARPIIPLVCGMLKIPIIKFITPSIIGCLLWTPLYFFPGILTGVIIHNSAFIHQKNITYLKWTFIFSIALIWIGIWILMQCWKKYKKNNLTVFYCSIKKISIFACMNILIGACTIIYIQHNPDIIFFRRMLIKIFTAY